MPHSKTILTLGENGLLAMDENEEITHYPSNPVEVKDVSGAGDAVAAILGLGLISDFSFLEVAKLANLVGGIACEEVGVVPVKAKKIREKWDSLNIG